MKCAQCGTELAGGSAFCQSCGSVTKDPTAETVAIQVTPAPEDPLLKLVKEALDQFYVVEKELGRGGMAVVYKGKERGLEREVAIKVLPPEMAMQGGTAERFKREARLAAALEHQNIIPVYRVGEERNLHYFAMKFVRGRAVDAILEQQGPLPVAIVTRILHDATAGLAHAHEQRIVHRDIKGANILIENDGRVLVSDFGIARAMEENSLTASGMVIGTPNFMSPEQCGGSKVGPQSDQYSMGILGFQLLTGALPFEADSIMGIIQHHYMTPPPDIAAVREGVPQELLDVIYKALAKKPEDRFATTHDMVEALEMVPIPVEEKREATRILKALSHGEPIAKVRTGSLPPVSLTASISGQRASTGRPGVSSGAATKLIARKPEKKSKAGLIAAAALVALGGGGAAVWQFVLKPQAAPPPAVTTPTAAPRAAPETVRIATPTPQAANPQPGTRPATRPGGQAPAPQPQPQTPPPVTQPSGSGQIIVSVPGCPTADIFVDGRRIGAGRASAEVPAGSRTVRVQAEGAAPFSTTVNVEAGGQTRVPVQSVTCGGE